MSNIVLDVQMLQKFDTEENWNTNNPILKNGQLGYVKDQYGSAKYKIGDGITPWKDLEWSKNYFIGTKAEYIAANDAGLIRPGMIICITDDNDYCNIPIDNEMSETSEHVVLNNTITKYVNTHDLKDNTVSSSIPPIDGGVPFAGAEIVSDSIGLGNFLSQNRSGFYTISTQNKWYNVISNRHRNGYGDGNNYGLVFLSNLTDANADLIWDRQHQSTWQGQRTILDSVNSINYFSKGVKDTHNSNNITLSYGKAGMNYNEYTWLAGWNNYELRAIHKNQFMAEVYANNFWGMAPNGDTSLWVRTTSQGIIPYQGGGRGGGHQYLGTDSWYFANSYIDHMHGVDLNLSNTITSSLSTGTHIAGARGTAIINCTAPGNGNYNMLAKMNSTNGIFNIGYYQSALKLYYISNSKINANQNGYDKEVTLLNESGNTGFPGQVSAANFSAGGSSTFTTATISNLTVNGSMRLKNNSVYGMKLNFGDGDYVYLHEDIDDHLIIHASGGLIIENPPIEIRSSTNSYINLKNNTGNMATSLTGITGVPFSTDGFNNLIYPINNDRLNNNSKHYFSIHNSSNLYKIGCLFVHSYYNNSIFLATYSKGGGVGIGGYNSNSTFFPCKDNWMILGESNVRWKQVYAVTSAISTSDRREKKNISYIGSDSDFEDTKISKEKFIRFMMGIRSTIFKRIDGDSNRPHHGIIAQDFEELLQELEIDHAAFIKSPETEKVEEKDEEGNVINICERVKENCDYRYGMRYEELVSDNIKFSQITYEEVQELKKENKQLKERISSLEEKLNLVLNNL